MSHVFARTDAPIPFAAAADGCQIWDEDGRRYLDASGGALVVGIGHGRHEVTDAVADQLNRVGYVHATQFRTAVLESYASELAAVVPMDGAHVYPVSGGSEAVETALKMARSYHLAQGEDRAIVLARRGSYHGNSRGALSVSGRLGMRRDYLPWLSHTVHVSAPYEYRCAFPDTHPDCAAAYARELEETIAAVGAENIAAFIAEPVCGAALGACVPPAAYWERIAEVCRRNGILFIADEVLTGFGRTGAWFASQHWNLRPDIIAAGKGAGAGYWPLGLAICNDRVHDVLAYNGFTHGFTYSHHAAGAAVGRAVLATVRRERLGKAAADNGPAFRDYLSDGLARHPAVGDIRGIGMLWAVELVADRQTKRPFARGARVVENVVRAAAERGLLVYSSTGCADGVDGDVIVLGPPLSATRDELREMADLCTQAVSAVLG